MEHKGPERVHDPGIAVIRQGLFGGRTSKVQRVRNLAPGRGGLWPLLNCEGVTLLCADTPGALRHPSKIRIGDLVRGEDPPFCIAAGVPARLSRDRRAAAEPGPPPDTAA